MRTSMVARTILATLILAAATGCGAATTAQGTAKPTVRIVSPVAGAITVQSAVSQPITVRAAISHFTLEPGVTEQNGGTGQVWFYLNGHPAPGGGSATATFRWEALEPPGAYSLKAFLVSNGKVMATSAPVVVTLVSASVPPTPIPVAPRVSCATPPVPSTGLKAGTITLFCKGLPAGGGGIFPGGGHELLAGPGGVWFTSQPRSAGTLKIGRITPAGGITVFDQGLPANGTVGNLVTGPGGDLWYTWTPFATSGGSDGKATLVRVTPSGATTLFSAGLPANASLGALVVGPGGNLWFGMDLAIGRMTPSGTITIFRKGISHSPNSLVVGPDGNVWFTTRVNGIGRITSTGVVTMFSKGLPKNLTNSANTCALNCGVHHRLVLGPGGDLWFIFDGLSGVGRITPAGTITIDSKGLPVNDYPYGTIAVGPDGNLWFPYLICSSTQQGCTNWSHSGIGRITSSGAITLFSNGLPTGTFPRSLVAGPDGDMWFRDRVANLSSRGTIGRITPSGVITLFSNGIPMGSEPINLTVGPDGNLWFELSGVYGGGHLLGLGRITP